MIDNKDDKPKLILGVKSPIWLSMTGPMEESESKITGWVAIKPEYDNGFIDKDTVLVFNHIYKPPEDGEEGLNFIMIRPGPTYEATTVEFFQKEIEYLTEGGVLEPYLVEVDIDEMSIVSGNLLIKYPLKLSFDDRFFVPKDMYIVMGSEESELSNFRIKVGEKLSLKRLLAIYSTAIGQNLVLK